MNVPKPQHSAQEVEHAMQPMARDPEHRVVVVGLPAAGIAELGDSALDALRQADVIIGSWRQLNLLDETHTAEKRPWPSPLRPSIVPMFEQLQHKKVVVLGSGDPMFHGIGTTLHQELQGWDIHVIPHASSASLACARMGWAVEHTPVLSLTTEPLESVLPPVRQHRRSLVLGRDESSPLAICTLLARHGIEARMSVLSDLGSPDEQIHHGTTLVPPKVESSLNVIAIELAPSMQLESKAPGSPDEQFQHDGQISKRHIRALSAAALAPSAGETLWDVGAGSGSVGIECLRLEPSCKVVAFEANAQRSERIEANAAAFGVSSRLSLLGSAPVAFDQAPAPDAVFIGGGLTQDEVFDAAWQALKPGGRLVANGVTNESMSMLIALQARFGGELHTIQIATQHHIGRFSAQQPALPVMQWVVKKANVESVDS
ncbi:precorrin-6y C5,15-methyltransferase (decarboxylating) subunit CbiE [Corynebacterium pseudopelargi]|nr:precorrin-6y C5,15-methyltransferase (decarboxylating) subunit CbiE [Corynebacterium pseudopelargi]